MRTQSVEPKKSGFAAALLASLLIHGTVLAAFLLDSAGDTVDLPPTVITVDVIAMSPDPGGLPKAGAPVQGTAQPSTPPEEPQANKDRQASDVTRESPAPAITKDVPKAIATPPMEEKRVETIEKDTFSAAVATVDDLAVLPDPVIPSAETPSETSEEALSIAFQPPPAKPPREMAPREARQPEIEPAAAEKLLDRAKSAISRANDTGGAHAPGNEALTVGFALGSKATGDIDGLPGVGDGALGVLQGQRFQLGAPGNPIPKYPDRARRRGQEGRVILVVEVSGDGKPLSVRIVNSSGYSLLDHAALRAVRRWRFHPAADTDAASVSVINVPITFKLEN